MAGTVTVSTWRTNPTGRLPLSKGRSQGQQAHRTAGTDSLSRYEQRVSDLVYSMYQAMPSAPTSPDGVLLAQYDRDLLDTIIEFHDPLRDLLQEQVDRSGTLASQELGRLLADEYRRVGKATAPLPCDLVVNLSFDRTNTRALAFATDEAGRLVTNMVAEQRQVVRDIIAEAYRSNQAPGSTARQLRQMLTTARPTTPEAQQVAQLFGANVNGLTRQYERAVVNRAGALAADLANRGIDGDKAYNMVRADTEKYASKLRRTRANTIARTETIRANNAGRMASYQQAMDDGFLSPQHSVKQWEVSPFDVCPICVGLGAGKPIKVDDYFQAGAVSVQYPPAHPNCRCTFNVVPNSQMYDIPSQVGTGEPGDPYRFDSGYGPRGVDLGRVVRPGRPAAPQAPGVPQAPAQQGADLLIGQSGKVPTHVVEPTGRVRIVGKDEYRETTGQWFRRKGGAVDYEEFTPSRNSGAGQIDRAIRQDPDRYRVSPTPPQPTPTPPTPSPTSLEPTPATPTPSLAPLPDSPLRVEVPQSTQRRVKVFKDATRFDDLRTNVPSLPGAADEWIGGTLSSEAESGVKALTQHGGRIRAKVDEVLQARAEPLLRERDDALRLVDEAIEQQRLLGKSVVDLDGFDEVVDELFTDRAVAQQLKERARASDTPLYRRTMFRDEGWDINPEWRYEFQDLLRGEEFPRDLEPGTLVGQLRDLLGQRGYVDGQALAKQREALEAVMAAQSVARKVTVRINEARAQVIREVLSASRPGFGQGSVSQWFSKVAGRKSLGLKASDVKDGIEDIARNIPKEWADNWARTSDWSLKWVNRGYYSRQKNILALSDGNWKRTLQHEVQHGVQGTNRPLYIAERSWLKMRVNAAGNKRVTWDRGEWGYDVDGVGKYTTREYLESRGYRGEVQGTEVTTTSMESVFHGDVNLLDQDQYDFMLGVLALL